MLAALLRRLSTTGLRRGMGGSRVWFVVGVVAAGVRVLRHLARDDEEILYRTAIRAGDVFEVVSRPRPR